MGGLVQVRVRVGGGAAECDARTHAAPYLAPFVGGSVEEPEVLVVAAELGFAFFGREPLLLLVEVAGVWGGGVKGDGDG